MHETVATKTRKKQQTKRALVKRVILVFAIWIAFGLGFRLVLQVFAAEPATSSFSQTWQRTDDPVELGLANRTWMWGPAGLTDAMSEPYAESPGGERTVQYFDKSRMEDSSFRATAPWDVTNGLLVVELVTGRMQVGDDEFLQYNPATVNVAGDASDQTGVQYATLAALRDAPALADGTTIIQRLDRAGNVTNDPALATFGISAAYRVEVPGIEHQVASPFWSFINSTGTVNANGAYIEAPLFLSPFYATGYPITEAYWANVMVGGTYQDVLLQCFERRCLTYTPGNPEGWQVEAGNVGQHYYTWRYGQDPAVPDPEGTPTPPDDSTAQPSPTAPPATGTSEPPASPTAEPTASNDPTPSATVAPDPTATAPAGPAPDYSFADKFGQAFNPATLFDEPAGVAASDDGFVYVTEWGAERVQKYTTEGLFVTMWRSNAPQDIAVDSHGDVYVTDTENKRVLKYDADGQPLGEVQGLNPFSSVKGIGVDDDDHLFVVDYDRVHEFDSNGTVVTSFKVTAADIAIDRDGVRYVLDTTNHRVQKLGSDGSDLGSWGDASTFDNLTNITVSDSGLVYVVDAFCSLCLQQSGSGSRVQVFRSDGTPLGDVGSSGSEPGQYQSAQGVAVDPNGNLFVADYGNNRIQKFSANGIYLDGWLGAHRGRISAGAVAMAVDEDGYVYIADSGRVQKFDSGGTFIWEFSELSEPVDLEEPSALVASPDGYLFVADNDLDKIVKLTLDGDFVNEWGGVGGISGLALDADGSLYAMVFNTSHLRKFSTSGTSLGSTDMSSDLSAPIDIAIDGDRLYVVDVDPSSLSGATSGSGDVPAVKIFDLSSRNFLGTLGAPDQFVTPFGIGIDPEGYVYVTDTDAHTVQQFAPDGTYLDTLSGTFDTPTAVQIAPDGTLYILEYGSLQVQIFE